MLRIHSIFPSINGEVSHLGQGSLCTFIRVQGCNLRCGYCDTKHAQNTNKGILMSTSQIIKKVESLKSRNITITGGEPLLQKEGLQRLVSQLYRLYGYYTSIETNGSFPIPCWPEVNCWVVDWKTPSSGMRDKMNRENLLEIKSCDFLKFVIADREDFKDAISVGKRFNLKNRVSSEIPKFAFSPVYKTLKPETLVEWMWVEKWCRDNSVILNLQLHKIIGVA